MRAFYAVAAAFVLAGLVAPLSATVQAADLEALFRAEIEMAAHNLRMNPRDLDDSAGLALAASGASWKPTAGGMPLLRQDGRRVAYTGWAGRREGLGAARAAGDARTEFAFALSLVLDPAPDAALWRQAYGVVARYGDGLDAALIGTIGAEDRLPLLPSLRYAAADVMVWRADPRHTQFWLTLGESRDAYLVSRAVAAMGIICYAVHPVGSSRDGGSREQTTPSAMDGLLAPVREWPISAIQRRIFESAISKAATDRSYRVRAAAALF
ncbi:MAG: hypothetical protein FJX72_14225, partial [Armatimonadetes bacterium]|nr:hypothetical protein [Armatimonadota bacterium]